ncbi:hypothetical protein F2Q69_00016995 [Brassica cretica]|uniref:Piwi domain-containing protein n=1 Tax=Brassica cretica TaxID=69181 RepID=A0A8S9QIY2_BRACR|nr:hypothetical protein F2Q69_00016995 [Brassica cretica]
MSDVFSHRDSRLMDEVLNQKPHDICCAIALTRQATSILRSLGVIQDDQRLSIQYLHQLSWKGGIGSLEQAAVFFRQGGAVLNTVCPFYSLKVFEQKLDSCLRQNPIATAVHEFPSLSAPIGDDSLGKRRGEAGYVKIKKKRETITEFAEMRFLYEEEQPDGQGKRKRQHSGRGGRGGKRGGGRGALHLDSPLQRYTKALNTFQRAALVEKSRQKPQEMMNVLSKALKVSNYDTEPLLRSCGISISSNFTQVEGRVVQWGCTVSAQWSLEFQQQGAQFVEPTEIDKWEVANVRQLVDDLIRIGGSKGIEIAAPFDVFEEGHQFPFYPPLIRVEKMFEEIQSKLPGAPQFLLCLIPERKNCNIYYSMLSVERTPAFTTVISKVQTIILGMDVSHGSPGQSDVPSIAAVVSSRQWPLVSKYRASVRTQPSKAEMIESLVKKNGTEDDGIIKFHFLDEIHFSPDELQELVHSLSYVYQRSITAISVVAPICYAHLAAAQLGTFMKFEDQSETSSSHGGVTAPGPVSVAQLPKLKRQRRQLHVLLLGVEEASL